MAGARKPPPGRGRAGLLLCAAVGLLLAGCEKLSDLGVHLDFEETAKAPVTAEFVLSDVPPVAPTPDEAAAAEAPHEAPAEAAPVVAAAPPPAPADTRGLTLRPEPVAVSVMMAAARPAAATLAAAQDEAAGDLAETSAPAERSLPLEMVPLPAPGGEPAAGFAVLDAPAAAGKSDGDGPGIATLLADLFAPLLEPAAGPAMASVPAGEATETAVAEVATTGVADTAEPADSLGTRALALPIGDGANGSDGDLTGLTEAEVEQLLGPPLSVRRDDPAESWQYATSDCILDLFFYEQTGAWRVVHMEARTIAALDAPADSCVKSVLAGRLLPSRTS